MFDNEVRFGGAKLVERVVAGKDGTGMNASVARGLDIVLHIADKQSFGGDEVVLFEELVDFFALVPNLEIRPIQERAETGGSRLHGKMVAMDRAQKKRAKLSIAAELEKLARVRQRTDR